VAAITASPAPASPASPAPASPAPASPATSSEILESAAPWWEKITVTVDDKGTQQACRYETSTLGAAACDKEMADSIKINGGGSGVFKKVTFERRFSPGGQPDSGKLRPGDILIGRQVMFLTFDESGAISSCNVVAIAGDSAPNYGCEQAKKEQFRAQANAAPAARRAFMTVLAYGHTENIA
jgi:hypothetical protein